MIKISRGDTAVYAVRITQNGELIRLEEPDRVIFTVRKHPHEESPIRICKELTTADYIEIDGEPFLLLMINPQDTENLYDCVYKYDCVLKTADGNRYTFITPTDFVVADVVHKTGVMKIEN